MNRMKRLATNRPVAFGLMVTLVFILMVLASSILGAVWPGEEFGQRMGGTIGRLVSISILLLVLSRLGWLHSAGVVWPASGRAWLIIVLPMAYSIGVTTYAMTGAFALSVSDPRLFGMATVFIVTAAALEEVAFRGLVLHAMVRAWGPSNAGLVRSVVVSSVLHGGMHLGNVLGGVPPDEALLQGVGAVWLGITLGAVVLKGYSLLPATVFHAALNIAGYMNLSSSAATPGTSAWMLYSVLMLPLVLYGLYILREVPQRSIVPDTV